MPQNNFLQPELAPCFLHQHFHLVLRHFRVRLVVDPGDFPVVLERAYDPPEVDHGTR